MSEPTPEPDGSSERFPPGWVPDEAAATSANNRGGRTRWIIGLAALAVVAIVVGVVVVSGGDDSDAASATSSKAPAPAAPTTAAEDPAAIASVEDIGPVALVPSDVTCQPWRAIQSTLASAQSNGWEQRDASIPAVAWTDEQRAQFEAVGTAMRSAAADAVALARQTPHRVMRELYEQFTAYGRAYADSLVDYEAPDDFLALTNIAAFQAISEICGSAEAGSAIARSGAVAEVAGPELLPALGDPANPIRFLPESGPTCARWVPADAALQAAVQTWLQLDVDVPADAWTPAESGVQQSAAALFAEAANTMEADGRGSGNAEFADFATLGAQYLRAYVAAVPNYQPADHSLAMAGLRLDNLIAAACQAAGR